MTLEDERFATWRRLDRLERFWQWQEISSPNFPRLMVIIIARNAGREKKRERESVVPVLFLVCLFIVYVYSMCACTRDDATMKTFILVPRTQRSFPRLE